MIKSLSFKVDEETVKQLEAEATKQNVTVSDILRWAVESYFRGEGQRIQNMKALLETIRYEEAKTRAVLMRYGDMLNIEFSGNMLKEAGADAEAYVEERKQQA